MSVQNHPWCSNVQRDEAIRAAEDDAANWRRLEVGEVIEAGDEFDDCGTWAAAMFCIGRRCPPREIFRRRRVPPPDHRDLPQAVNDLRRRVEGLETVADHWRRQCEADADAENREAAPGSRAGVNIMPLSPGESVRVVEASNEADVAGMEYRGNSVGYWYAKAESYRQVIRDCRQQLAAVNGETLAQAAARLTAERDAAIRHIAATEQSRRDAIRDLDAALEHCKKIEARLAKLVGQRDAARRERDEAREEAERRLTMCESMKRERDSSQFNVSCLKARVAHLESAPAANAGVEQPQPPRGWLTEEEREALESARLHLSNSDYLDEATERECKWASDVVRRLLTRSTPPLVRRPKVFQTHEFSAAVLGVMELRDREWIAAIREAGGEVE